MAMIPCKECGEIINDKLKTCPQCSFPIRATKRKWARWLKIIGAIMSLASLLLIFIINLSLILGIFFRSLFYIPIYIRTPLFLVSVITCISGGIVYYAGRFLHYSLLPQAAEQRTGLAKAALLIGIVGLVSSILPFIPTYLIVGICVDVLGLPSEFLWIFGPGYLFFFLTGLLFAFICDLLGVILGNKAIYKARKGEAGGERMAKAGKRCGFVGFIFIGIWTFLFMATP